MKVKDLIEKFNKINPDLEVRMLYDVLFTLEIYEAGVGYINESNELVEKGDHFKEVCVIG